MIGIGHNLFEQRNAPCHCGYLLFVTIKHALGVADVV